MRLLVLLIAGLGLSSCSMMSLPELSDESDQVVGESVPNKDKAGEIKVNQSATKGRLITLTEGSKDLNYFVQKMMHELVSNIVHVKAKSVIATSTFVYVDSNYLSATLFAKQLQESFTYQFHKIGQPILELKSTGYIRILPEGDFALSKDFHELKSYQPVNYILMGTLTELTDGVQVNAKLVGVSSHAVVGVAQTVIPREIVENMVPSHYEGQTIKLISATKK